MSTHKLHSFQRSEGRVSPDRIFRDDGAFAVTPEAPRIDLAEGSLDEDAERWAVANELHLPRCVRSSLARVDLDVIAMLPWEVAAEYAVVPIGLDPDGDLRVAMVNPTDALAVHEIEFFSGRRAMREVACADDVAEALERYYGVARARRPQVMAPPQLVRI